MEEDQLSISSNEGQSPILVESWRRSDPLFRCAMRVQRDHSTSQPEGRQRHAVLFEGDSLTCPILPLLNPWSAHRKNSRLSRGRDYDQMNLNPIRSHRRIVYFRPSQACAAFSFQCHILVGLVVTCPAERDEVFFGIIAGVTAKLLGGGLPGSTSCRIIDTASRRDAAPAGADPRTPSDPAARGRGFGRIELMMPSRSGLQ